MEGNKRYKCKKPLVWADSLTNAYLTDEEGNVQDVEDNTWMIDRGRTGVMYGIQSWMPLLYFLL